MEQHKDMIRFCTNPFCNKNESGEAFFIEEYADMGLKKLLALFYLADPERPPDSELKEYTWGQYDFSRIDEVCPICLTGLYLRSHRSLENCKHRLHGRCLKELVESGARHCPVCRAEMHRSDGANYEYPDDPEFVL
ncbi:RING finger domain-containing protein [Endozoicomonas euniceicola]|uniref:RING-type domain-containing protein n=1 Tax=Endozoicomonas euniceicola TaxID=1234143 RepID=A0ABY6GZE0_9GAMM|nr:RING finger domain-containing protein [Endozoicomonas euniceicola]UYM17411.1 hypothetical protein NX720_05690 [Endozoicomonas euniceicola]